MNGAYLKILNSNQKAHLKLEEKEKFFFFFETMDDGETIKKPNEKKMDQQ